MKRITRIILSCAISALLLSAVFVAAVFADTDTVGITATREQDYENIKSDFGGSAVSGFVGGDVYGWNVDGRIGRVETVRGLDDNSYVVFTQADKSGSSIPYFGTGYGGSGTTARPTLVDGAFSAPGDISNYPYLVFDFDFMSPTGNYINGARVDLQLRAWLQGESSVTMLSDPTYSGLFVFGSDAGGSFIYIATAPEATKTYLDPYTFNHLTFIYEAVVTAADRAVNTHVYLNGEYFYSQSGKPMGVSYYNGIPNLNFDEIRVNFTTALDPSQSLAFDNIVTRLCDKSYNGNLSEVIKDALPLSEWESNIYDPENMPCGYSVAYNVTKNTQYRSVFEAINSASDGDFIRIDSKTAESALIDKELTLELISDNVEITAAEGYISKMGLDGKLRIESVNRAVIEYISDGKSVTGTNETSLSDVFSSADDGSTVRLLSDLHLELTASVSVKKNITLDLTGHDFVIAPPIGGSAFSVGAGCTLKLTNGRLVSEFSSGYYARQGYPVVSLSNNSGLILDTLDTFSASMVWSYSATGTSVEVYGGRHHIDIPTATIEGGFIQMHANTAFTAKDAHFFIGADGDGLINSLHYREDGKKKGSTFTFEGCSIICERADINIIPYANEFTSVNFIDCDIFGSITPELHDYDATVPTPPIAPMKTGSVVCSGDTRIGKGVLLSEAVGTPSAKTFSSVDEEAVYERNTLSGTLADENVRLNVTRVTCKYAYEVSETSTYTVRWFAADGKTVIRTETVGVGATVTPPPLSEVGKNGWLKVDYVGWSATRGGDPTTSFVINRNSDFYPVYSEDKAELELSSVKFNLSFTDKVVLQLYIPTSSPEGVEIFGVYSAGGVLYPRNVKVNGEEYARYSVTDISAVKLHESVTVTVVASVNGVRCEQKITLSPLDYVESVLLDSRSASPAYSDSTYILLADMIRYSVRLCEYYENTMGASLTGTERLSALLEEYGALCTPLETDFSDVSYVDVSALSGIVKSVELDISGLSPSFRITFEENSRVVGFYATVSGYKNQIGEGVTLDSVDYRADRITKIDGTEYFSHAYVSDIPLYNFDRNIIFTAMLETGEDRFGIFNLNGYYSMLSAEYSEPISDVFSSLRALSASSKAHKKLSVGKNSEGADFRGCTHENSFVDRIIVSYLPVPGFREARYCPECDHYLFPYSDYGAVGDGVTNDIEAIRRAHEAANSFADLFPGFNVLAVSGKGTFYIGKPEKDYAIDVYTSADWNGAHFIIDDTVVDIDGADRGIAKQPIFLLTGDSNSARDFEFSKTVSVKSGAANIGIAPGRPLMIKLTNTTVRHYIRQGINENSGAYQTEVILIDEYGNIDPTTPVEWDYNTGAKCSDNCKPRDVNSDNKCDVCKKSITNSVTAYAYTVTDTPITISGLDKDGNINCKWETRTNSNVSLETYNQYSRNILVSRSNTTVEGIDRIFVEDDTNSTPRQTYAAYVNVSLAYNTVIKDMLVNQHISHYQTNGALLGSYEFGGNSSINTSWINCKIKNFFNSNGTVTYRGMFGSNYMRNSYLKGCVLTSFDSHSGAYNVTIEDSTFEHINYVGGGQVIMKNVTVYVDGGQGACILRQDYGSMWKGDLYMDGLTLRHAASYGRSYIDIVKSFYTNWYFGYTSHLPGKIYVNNVKIEQYTRSSASYTMGYGSIDEPNVRNSSKKLAIHGQINSQMKKDYDYSTSNANNLDPKVCTEAVYITNSNVAIYYPDHWYFKNMKVYIDGVEQDWFKVRSGLHKDANSDGVCDNGCGQPLG